MATIETFLIGTLVASVIIIIFNIIGLRKSKKLPNLVMWVLVILTAFAAYLFFFHYLSDQLNLCVEAERDCFGIKESILKELSPILEGLGIGTIVGLSSLLRFSRNKETN